jgi:hypothetical protein
MHSSSHRAGGWFLAGLLVLSLTSPVWAYIPRSSVIIKQLASRVLKVRQTLLLEAELTVFAPPTPIKDAPPADATNAKVSPAAKPRPIMRLMQRYAYQSPDRYRWESRLLEKNIFQPAPPPQNPPSEKSGTGIATPATPTSAPDGNAVRWQTNVIIKNGERYEQNQGKIAPAPFYNDNILRFILHPANQSLFAFMESIGVDTDTVRLGRDGENIENKQVVYIIGARNSTNNPSQYWVDHDNFEPARIIYRQKNATGLTTWALRFEEYVVQGDHGGYPSRITIFENDTMVGQLLIHSIDLEANLPGNLFDTSEFHAVK